MKITKFLFLLIALILLAFFSINKFSVYLNSVNEKSKDVALLDNANDFVEEKQVLADVVDEKVNQDSPQKENDLEKIKVDNQDVSSSENFEMKNIKFGGMLALTEGDDEFEQLQINEVKSAIVSSEDKKDNKILITWKTNKLAISTVEYSKEDGIAVKKFNEVGYGFNHSVILSGLEPGTRYFYSLKIRDRWGNTINSQKYATYIGMPKGSIIDIISKEFDEIFGWALK